MRISDWSSDVCSSDLETPRSISICSGAIGASSDRTRSCRIRGSGRRRPAPDHHRFADAAALRSEEHTSELQSLMRISYAVFCLKKKKYKYQHNTQDISV